MRIPKYAVEIIVVQRVTAMMGRKELKSSLVSKIIGQGEGEHKTRTLSRSFGKQITNISTALDFLSVTVIIND